MRIFLIAFSIQMIMLACNKDIANDRPNVLFICVDDLRTELGVYGNEHIVSPNLDRLASNGAVFTNHFVNVPTCGASRYTLLSGLLPRTGSELGNDAIRRNISDRVEGYRPESFIHHLRRNGYHTVGIGKIGHYVDGLIYGYNDSVSEKRELPYSWDELLFDAGQWETGWNAFFGYADGSNRQSKLKQVKPYEKGMVGDNGYPDGLTRDLSIRKLRELANRKEPFFLGVGFFKPHLPFNSPSSYWDLYNEENLPLSDSPFIPSNINTSSLRGVSEMNQYELGEEKSSLDNRVSDDYARKARHAYFACVSYVDALIGSLIDELKILGLYDNTLIVVWGDHGWQLGDHLVWGKHTLFEDALKSSLIIKVPGIEPKVIDDVVSTIDLYPTIMELCNISAPDSLDGRSLIGILTGDINNQDKPAFSYYRNGISMRTPGYRISRYYRKTGLETELYDLKLDPYESRNIADDNPYLVDSLLLILEKFGNTGLYNK